MVSTSETKAGDKGKAICEQCSSVVITEYQYRDVPFSDNSAVVQNLLVAICTRCDSVSSLPHQSTSKVADVYNNRNLSCEWYSD